MDSTTNVPQSSFFLCVSITQSDHNTQTKVGSAAEVGGCAGAEAGASWNAAHGAGGCHPGWNAAALQFGGSRLHHTLPVALRINLSPYALPLLPTNKAGQENRDWKKTQSAGIWLKEIFIFIFIYSCGILIKVDFSVEARGVFWNNQIFNCDLAITCFLYTLFLYIQSGTALHGRPPAARL